MKGNIGKLYNLLNQYSDNLYWYGDEGDWYIDGTTEAWIHQRQHKLSSVQGVENVSTEHLLAFRCWFGASKSLAAIASTSIIGAPFAWAAFGLQRAFENTSWHYCYGHPDTGEILSDSREKAYDVLNSCGCKYYENGKFDLAYREFDHAYRACPNGYKDEQIFKTNRDNAQAELDALALNEQGNTLFSQGRYSEAQTKYQEAYDKSNNKANYDIYSANRYKAQAKLNAQALNEQGDVLYNKQDYAGALKKYDEAIVLNSNNKIYHNDKARAHNKLKNYDEAIKCADKALEIDKDCQSAKNAKARALNDQGHVLYNKQDYTGALKKYDEAIVLNSNNKIYHDNKAWVHYNLKNYDEAIKCADKALEIDKDCQSAKNAKARALNDQGHVLYNKQDYTGALNKYDKASELDSNDKVFHHNKAWAHYNLKNYDEAIKCADKALEIDKDCQSAKNAKARALNEQYNSVLNAFNRMLDINDSELLNKLNEDLGKMVDTEECRNDSAIVNRFHIVSLRIARNEMNNLLTNSTNQEGINELRTAIINLIETEINVLRELNISDSMLNTRVESLEQESDLLEERLNTNVDDEEDNNVLIDLEEIASLKEIEKEIEREVLNERLAEDVQLECGGNAIELREPLIAPIVETYLMNGMNEILQLRISSTEEENTKQIKLLPSNIANTGIGGINLHDVANQLAHETNKNEITVMPLLVTTQNSIGSNINHWVGLISERTLDSIIISYLDSENSSLEGLNKHILDAFEVIYPDYKVSFREIAVEQQRYNNCGPELIENIMLYITGSRVDQDSAIYFHSSLSEQSLILADIEASKAKDKKTTLTTLSDKATSSACNGEEFAANYDDLVSSISECTNLSGAINYDMENL